MKLSPFFFLLASAALEPARAQSMVATQLSGPIEPHAPAGAPTQVPGPAASGHGHGVFTTPGLIDGSVLAQLQDRTGARCYTLTGFVYPMIECCGGGVPTEVEGAFAGALIAPGEEIAVQGTWRIDVTGVGLLAAVILGDDGAGGVGEKLGRIDGVFLMPDAGQQEELTPVLLQRRAVALRVAALRKQPKLAHGSVLVSAPVLAGGDLLDPAILGVEAPLSLTWSIGP